MYRRELLFLAIFLAIVLLKSEGVGVGAQPATMPQ